MVRADLSSVFIDRPILAAVLSIVVFVAGLLAIPNLAVTEYPQVSPPTIQVTAIYPGANPRTIAETVAAPLEEAINGVEYMSYMKSASASDGTLNLTITFKLGTDIDLAAIQVQNRVAQALPRLPEAVRALGVTTVKSSPNITLVVHLRSPDGRYDALYLNNFANLRIRDELARLDGVGQAIAFGAGNYAMRIWLDPDRVAERGLSAARILSALRDQNVQVSAGSIGAPPQASGAAVQMSVNVQGRLDSPEQFGAIVLNTDAQGAVTRLSDVARIELGAQSYAINSLLNNEVAAAVVIFEAPGANSIALSDAVRAKMTELAVDFPEGIVWEVVYDPTVFVRQSIASVLSTLLEAVLFVVLVVVLFLQTWRASIIPLLAVPVSIVGTFAVLWILGFSINVLTLFGLVLAIGIVVDDAIVVVENVERHIQEGLPPRAAAHRAMSEVSGPIVAISLVLTAVFVPLAFLGGVTGEFYRQFAVTIAVSVLISAANSLSLSPAMAAVLLQPHGAPPDRFGRLITAMFGGLFAAFNRRFKRSSAGYSRNIAGIIDRAPRMLALYAGLLAITVFAFRAVPGGFIPTQDKQYLFAGVLLPEGATLERSSAAMRQIGDLARAHPGVANVVQFPGLNAIHFVSTPNVGVAFIGLKPPEQRVASATQIASDLSMAFSQIQDGLAFALMPPPVFGYGNAAGFEMYVQDRVGLGYGELHQQVQNLLAAFSRTPGFGPGAVITSYQANVPQLDAEVDRLRVLQSGLSLSEVFTTLQVYLGSAYVNDFNLFGRTFGVYLQADAPFRDQIEDIGRLQVPNRSGAMIPLASVLEVRERYGPDPVVRYNGYPAADIQGAPFDGSIGSEQTLEIARALARTELAQGMGFEWTGLTYQQTSQGVLAWLVFPLAVLLVYLVLAGLYESWSLPLAVILIVPLCLLCAIGGIWLVNQLSQLAFVLQLAAGWIPPPPMSPAPVAIDNNIFTQIGLVVLMGLACKNAILIVEFARDLERAGHGYVDAALEAARLRLRPILMTSFAFIAGVTPLMFAGAFGDSAGSEVRHVMGLTVFAGMLGVTFFGLYFTPVFYVLVRRMFGRVGAPDGAPEHA